MPQPEARLQRKIRKTLEQEFGGFWYKIHGGPFMPAGIPDLLGCVDGIYIALEVKLPKKPSKPSAKQLQVIGDIRAAGGVAGIVRSVEDARAIVAQALAEAEEGRRLRIKSKRRRARVRAANGKDVHNDGRAKRARRITNQPDDRARKRLLRIDGVRTN